MIEIINEEEEYDDVLEKDEEFESETFLQGQADWLKYDNVRQGILDICYNLYCINYNGSYSFLSGQNCSAEFRLFSVESERPIVAISSFPGSGNTWARHLLVSDIYLLNWMCSS